MPSEETKSTPPSKTKVPKFDTVSAVEKLGTTLDSIRDWLGQSWKIALMMGRGAYLISERRRLFSKLGEEVYYKFTKGELTNSELEPIVKQLDKLTKKVELEEMLIRSTRFGREKRKSPPDHSTQTAETSPHA